jgi:hypothetical protein
LLVASEISVTHANDFVLGPGLGKLPSCLPHDLGASPKQKNPQSMSRRSKEVWNEVGAIEIFRKLAAELHPARNIDTQSIVQNNKAFEKAAKARPFVGKVQGVSICKCERKALAAVESIIELRDDFISRHDIDIDA